MKKKVIVTIEVTENENSLRNHRPMPMVVEMRDMIEQMRHDYKAGSELGHAIGKKILQMFEQARASVERAENKPRRIWIDWRGISLMPAEMSARQFTSAHSHASVRNAFMVMAIAQAMAEFVHPNSLGNLLLFVNASPPIKETFERVLSRLAKDKSQEPSFVEMLLEGMERPNEDVPF